MLNYHRFHKNSVTQVLFFILGEESSFEHFWCQMFYFFFVLALETLDFLLATLESKFSFSAITFALICWNSSVSLISSNVSCSFVSVILAWALATSLIILGSVSLFIFCLSTDSSSKGISRCFEASSKSCW